MFRVLILGSRGNLGSELMEVFSYDYEVIGWDRDEIDITEYKKLEKSITNVEPDIIINTVAYNAVDKCEESEIELEKARELNGEAVKKLAEISLELDAVFVHYVSDYIFDGQKKEGYKEDDKPLPINKYGFTKLLGEQSVLALASQGLKYHLIRTSKLFGSSATSENAKPSFFDIMLEKAKKKERIEVVDAEMSCFTYTPDLAWATLDLLEDLNPYGIYHLINEGAVTWYSATKTLFELKKIDTKLIPVLSDKFPRPAARPAYSVLLNTKTKKLRNYKEALKEYLENLK
ncbi:MAG: dTDP-4-dehydrorhamnose reductase [Patescibacteria group bacterium]|nr:dTDP-4-dehydrorhamnose reductase [Patescibacteria group bacterium]